MSEATRVIDIVPGVLWLALEADVIRVTAGVDGVVSEVGVSRVIALRLAEVIDSGSPAVSAQVSGRNRLGSVSANTKGGSTTVTVTDVAGVSVSVDLVTPAQREEVAEGLHRIANSSRKGAEAGTAKRLAETAVVSRGR